MSAIEKMPCTRALPMISFTGFHARTVSANMKKNLTFICLGVVFLASYAVGMVLFTYLYERK